VLPRKHDVSRLEGFSDAVFAFAVTLLVVSLEVPRTFGELREAMRGFVAFGICFALLFQIWWRHHTYFRRYGLDDSVTRALTGVLLFVVLFYVYPLKFLWTLAVTTRLGGSELVALPDGRVEAMILNEQVPLLFEIYGLGAAAVFTLFAILYAHALGRRRELALTPVEILDTRLSVMSNAGLASVGLASAAIAWLGGQNFVGLAGWIYFSIGFIEWQIGRYGRRTRRKVAIG
jgi:uncharacterized membrane protein